MLISSYMLRRSVRGPQSCVPHCPSSRKQLFTATAWLYVVRSRRKLLSCELDTFLLCGHPNLDFWVQILALLASEALRALDIIKVKAHWSQTDATSPEERWDIAGNDKADKLAKTVLFQARVNHDQPIWGQTDEKKLLQRAQLTFWGLEFRA